MLIPNKNILFIKYFPIFSLKGSFPKVNLRKFRLALNIFSRNTLKVQVKTLSVILFSQPIFKVRRHWRRQLGSPEVQKV